MHAYPHVPDFTLQTGIRFVSLAFPIYPPKKKKKKKNVRKGAAFVRAHVQGVQGVQSTFAWLPRGSIELEDQVFQRLYGSARYGEFLN